jgi:hypothetical protein
MAIELQPASQEDIAAFKLAVAQRFQERGVPAAQADAILGNYMAKLAAEMGLVEQAPTVNPDHVEKVASYLATQLGLTRANKGK